MQTAESGDIDAATLDEVIRLVHVHTGITMTSAKKVLLQSRLRRRLQALGIHSYDQYVQHLQDNKSEVQEFVNSVTTNETSFFRTARVWEFFAKEFLPDWSKTSMTPLRIWSAAASTGEEAYTIAMCCEEYRLLNPTFDYSVFGSDISTKTLSVAEQGMYGGRTPENFKATNPTLFAKYLIPTGEKFAITDKAKQKVSFAIHNLLNLPPKIRSYDIIFLRNVLIYFQSKDQEKILMNMSRALVPGGILVIGESESLNNLQTKFKFKSPFIYENSRD